MTAESSTPKDPSHDLYAAIGRATLAPSVHNTQPWLFHLTRSGVELFGDSSRRLAALDPATREFTLSCGAALLHLRLALQARGYAPNVELFPEAGRDDLVARIEPGRQGAPDVVAERLDACADVRQTNRRAYHGEVPADAIARLQAAAEAEGAGLQVVAGDDRTNVMVWQQLANRAQLESPAYRRELHSWVNAGRRDDGIPVASTVEPDGRPHDLAARDFAFDQEGGFAEGDDEGAELLVLFTEGDDRGSWVNAGQALARLWLEATRLGLVLQPLSQSVEEPAERMLLREGLRLGSCWPQLLLRVGHAVAQPGTPRRSVGDLTLIDADVAGAVSTPTPPRTALVPHGT